MKLKLTLFLLLLPSHLQPSQIESWWIVWNVGQGLWTTRVTQGECWHFDLGGEKWPLRELQALCAKKRNRIFLSHADLDHINGLSAIKKQFRFTCLEAAPREPQIPSWKRALFENLASCPPVRNPAWIEVSGPLRSSQANQASRVWILEGKRLLTGDSPSSEEKIWLNRMSFKQKNNLRFLVAGHHGSRTSTSENLLKQLPGLQQALFSARFRRYRHPHAETLKKIKRAGIPALLTEHWGHLRYEEKSRSFEID